MVFHMIILLFRKYSEKPDISINYAGQSLDFLDNLLRLIPVARRELAGDGGVDGKLSSS